MVSQQIAVCFLGEVEKDRQGYTMEDFSSLGNASPIRTSWGKTQVMPLVGTLLLAESLLFLGGALTALGVERVYWKISPVLTRVVVKKWEGRNRN